MSIRALVAITVAVGLIAILAGGGGLLLSGGTLPRFRSSLPQRTTETLAAMELPGREPPETPTFTVELRVEPSDGKNRLYFDISEDHGYFVETLRIQFWRVVTDPVTGAEQRFRPIEEFLEVYIKEDETLTHHLELVPAELRVRDEILRRAPADAKHRGASLQPDAGKRMADADADTRDENRAGHGRILVCWFRSSHSNPEPSKTLRTMTNGPALVHWCNI